MGIRRSASRSSIAALATLPWLVACSAKTSEPGFGDPGAGNGNGSPSGNGATTQPAGNDAGGNQGGGLGGGLLGGVQEAGASAADAAPSGTDGGFSCVQDPSQYDIPGNGCDDDNDGKVDNVSVCDGSLSAAGPATDFLKAMGICQTSTDATHWGLVSATFTNGHSQTTPGGMSFDAQHGILSTFGSALVPREGYSFSALSSGSATATDSDNGPDFKGTKNGMQGPAPFLGTTGNGGDVPAGFPKSSGACTVSSEVNDVIDVKVQVRVPTNAKGFSFDFNFMSGEWPDFVCSTYNDSFIAFLQSKAFNGGAADNMSFDANGNTISVNNNFFQACTVGVQTGCSGGTKGTSTCTLGPDQLAGTGFAADSPPVAYCGATKSTSGGGTGWLTSKAPVQPGEVISLEFLIWDTGDESFDSSVLLDNFTWVPDPLPPTPITIPSPPPPPPPPPK